MLGAKRLTTCKSSRCPSGAPHQRIILYVKGIKLIIDSHTHIGTISYSVGKNRVSNLRRNDLITALDKYQIDFALVSSIEGSEFTSEFKLVSKDKQVPQAQVISRTIEFAKKYPSKLRALLWIKPYTELYNDKIEQLIIKNREFVAGFKIHPSLSNLKVSDKKIYPYIELAKKYNLPVQVHTENDGKSNIKYLRDVLEKFNDNIFVMVHMGLNTDNSEAIELIRNNENLYGDTCLVEKRNVLKAIIECGSDKILFGTDAIVNGIDTYQKYLPVIEAIKKHFTKEEAENVLALNCKRIYGLRI